MSYDYRLDKYYDDAENQIQLNDEFVTQLNTSKRYSEMNKIAAGGMKSIFKAFDEKTQRYIAYATLNKDSESKAHESFIKEARLTAKLNHPNIIPVYNMGLDEKGLPFFTMELKSGDSLQDIIKKLKEKDPSYTDQYSLRDLLGIFIKVCDAIDFAHSKKVLHLDIKPDNIQVGSYGEVIVCDWGLSKIYDQQTDTIDLNQKLLTADKLNTSTLDGYIKGSPGYMAPEQISGEKKTPKTDIFSLGCLLYSMLNLEAPFKGDNLSKVLENTLQGNYSQAENIPESIQAVLNKAMAVDSEERYESVSKLKDDIENFLNGYATQAEDASSLKLLKLFILRNKAITAISILSLLIIVAGTVTFVLNITEEKERAEENLRLFKAQKEETYRAQKEYYEALINKQNSNFHLNYDDRPLESHQKTIRGLKELIEAYPKYSEAKSALGYHLFISQKFHQSEKYLSKDPGIYAYMLPYIERYKDRKSEKELLSPQDFVELLKDIKPLKPLHLKLLMTYSAGKKDPALIIPAVKHILTRLNPEWNSDRFIYKVETERLSISGENFKRLNINFNGPSPIFALRIKSLALRGTGVENIAALKDSPIRALDIANTKVPFHNLYNNLSKALLRLIITSTQYKKIQLDQLPGVIELKYADIKE